MGVVVRDDSFMSYGMCSKKRERVGGDGQVALEPLVDPTCFFADDGRKLADKMKVVEAKLACSVCMVKDDCLEFALAARIEHGIWGGTTPDQRVAILRRRLRPAV